VPSPPPYPVIQHCPVCGVAMMGSKSKEDRPRDDVYSCLRCETVVSLAHPSKNPGPKNPNPKNQTKNPDQPRRAFRSSDFAEAAGASAVVTERLTIRGDYTYTKAIDATRGSNCSGDPTTSTASTCRGSLSTRSSCLQPGSGSAIGSTGIATSRSSG
jgi:hypothetical protein